MLQHLLNSHTNKSQQIIVDNNKPICELIRMKDETASTMYESARERLQELLRKEAEIKEQISGWVPVVEQLARLCGEKMDAELLKRANPAQNSEIAGQEIGLTEAIRWVFRQPLLLPLTPTQVRDHLAQMGYDLEKYKHVMPPIHNTLKRMKEAGEIREVDGVGGSGKAFVSAK
jgi:exonuclease I